jgi:hypothetical protein
MGALDFSRALSLAGLAGQWIALAGIILIIIGFWKSVNRQLKTI